MLTTTNIPAIVSCERAPWIRLGGGEALDTDGPVEQTLSAPTENEHQAALRAARAKVHRPPGGPTNVQAPALRIRGVRKNFGPVRVLKGIDLDIGRGEIHGLIGGNGSGKSTLIKILGGVYTPESDSVVELGGVAQHFPISQPHKHGLAIIHQDLALADNMSVAENIGISSSYGTRAFGRINAHRERESVASLLSDFNQSVDPLTMVGDLAPAQRSITAILRAMRQLRTSTGPKVLVLDEPTAALPQQESQQLYDTIRRLAASGAGVLFVTHRMKEIFELCDRVSVLRDGKLVATREPGTTTPRDLVNLMLGYDLGDFYPAKHLVSRASTVVELSDVSGDVIRDMSFTVGVGEILGVTGLAGMGQDELPELIAGLGRLTTGRVAVHGVTIRSLTDARNAGVALVPANRHRDGIWLDGTATENLTLPFLGRFVRHRRISHSRERAFAAVEFDRIGLSPLMPDAPASQFSGGNQQKVVLAKWIQTNPSVLMLHEPTQGVDVGAKKDVLHLVRQAADDGAAVIMCSSDTDEIAEVCHRAIILRYGQIARVLTGAELTSATIAASLQ
jgi:ribose transport system ATP-binding protein